MKPAGKDVPSGQHLVYALGHSFTQDLSFRQLAWFANGVGSLSVRRQLNFEFDRIKSFSYRTG